VLKVKIITELEINERMFPLIGGEEDEEGNWIPDESDQITIDYVLKGIKNDFERVLEEDDFNEDWLPEGYETSDFYKFKITVEKIEE